MNNKKGKVCICPCIEVRAFDYQITEKMLKSLADTYKASVIFISLDDGSTFTTYGPHRSDCPCKP